MIHFDLPKEKSSIIKVIGIGGGGSNAVNYMHSQGIDGVNFIICNTDSQAIANSKVPNKIQLGPHLTQGLGAGANPEIGRQATEESLEEIRRILEVNTKMAFITAGMGGGTGTGGAPIVARICKEMGILTVGIITTPFAYEGRKRILQGEEGINRLKDNVDTLLVISNDKLRHQYGNLKMKEAFAKADNVLATAAKCITDVINSTGQINVDFADVCTVMRNGGVAILGSGAAEGDNRAQRAIEQALNSPLLNDNDIRGAKWILININSCEGEHEFTMDEVDIIQNYLLSQAGSNSDVIMGLGYDSSLGSKIGITLIATGFDHKEALREEKVKASKAPVREEKIVMTLGMEGEEKKLYNQQALFPQGAAAGTAATAAAAQGAAGSGAAAPGSAVPTSGPSTSEPEAQPLMIEALPIEAKEDHMAPSLVEMPPASTEVPFFISRVDKGKPLSSASPVPSPAEEKRNSANNSAGTSRGFLARPANIYADSSEEPAPVNHTVVPVTPDTTPTFDMQLVIRDEPAQTQKPEPARLDASKTDFQRSEPQRAEPTRMELPRTEQSRMDPTRMDPPRMDPPRMDPPRMDPPRMDPPRMDPSRMEPLRMEPVRQDSSRPGDSTQGEEGDEQRRKAAERLQKLRNLSFNVNAPDTGSEFEAVPAYVRRNMELYNTVNSIENFYSNYTVKSAENNKGEISTLNTFLEGKKPD